MSIFKRKSASNSSEPLLDIVVLVHDQAPWADLCIRSVEHFTKNAYRLILVDMASVEDETHELFRSAKQRGHTVVHLNENRSFSNGVNMGVAAGNARFICILNDDAIVTEGWDTCLLQDSLPKHVGLVGARSNYASGAQMDGGFVGEPPYLVFVCVALRRDVWRAVGSMDEKTFDGFSSEDIDYSWRVKKAGYKLALSRAYVLHAGSRTLHATVGVHGEGGVPSTVLRSRNDQKYNARLVEKHGKEWAAKYSTTVKKVLVVSYHANSWEPVDFGNDMLNLKTFGGHAFTFSRAIRVPITMARNAMADLALDGGYDYILQLDDDARFPPDTIKRLLTHDVDVVTALAYQRRPPHLPCIFETGPDGAMGASCQGWEHTGLRKVDVSGFHVSVIATSVFKRMREGLKEMQMDGSEKVVVPGTRHYYGWFSQQSDLKVGEDFGFCILAKKLGIQIHCDTNFIAGHMGDAINVDEAYKQAFDASQVK